MPKPAETQILDEVGIRLANITEVDGYFTTAARIDRARMQPYNGGDLPALNYWAGVTELAESGAGWRRRMVTVMVEYQSKTWDRPFADVAHELAADIDIALRRAPAAPAVADTEDTRLGGLVDGMEWQSKTPAIGEGQAPVVGVLMEYVITYSHPIGDPTTINQ